MLFLQSTKIMQQQMIPFYPRSVTSPIYSPELNNITVCTAYNIEVLAVCVNQGCKISRRQFAQTFVALNICVALVWKLLRVTVPAPGITRRFLDARTFCAPLWYVIISSFHNESSVPSKNLNIYIYIILILPVVVYGYETWSFTLGET